MACWVIKSDTADYSIDEFKEDKIALWEGVRNYQARNFLMEMEVGDKAFFYQSVTDPVGIAGLCKVSKKAVADPSQFDKKSRYFDTKATKQKPRWYCPEFKFIKKYKSVIGLSELRGIKGLEDLIILKRGNRLSVTPVTEEEFKVISEYAEKLK